MPGSRVPGRKHCGSFRGPARWAKWQQINLHDPSELSEADYRRVLSNVVEALGNLGQECLVFKPGVAESIPQAEQEAALAELRQMGIEPKVSSAGSRIELQNIPGRRPAAGVEVKAQAVEIMRLVRTTRGERSQIAILARSKAAVVDFL